MQTKAASFFETKDCFMGQPLQVKDVDTSGRHVVFYAAAFGNVDSHGDIIMPGAFKKTIAERGPSGSDQMKYLNQHDTWQLGGKIVEAIEDSHGLLLTAKVAKTTLGDDMLELEAEGAYEHSIGYNTIKAAVETREAEDVRVLLELLLWEGSAVTWGSNPNTPTVGIKSHGESPAAHAQRLLANLTKFNKLLRKGNLSNETCQLLEVQNKQIQQVISDLLTASLITPEPATVSTPEGEPSQKQTALEALFNSIKSN